MKNKKLMLPFSFFHSLTLSFSYLFRSWPFHIQLAVLIDSHFVDKDNPLASSFLCVTMINTIHLLAVF